MVEVTLQIQSGEDAFKVPLGSQSLSLGRADLADLVINDSGLSRVHATIHRNNEAVWIIDENSANGSYVNGAIVGPKGTLLQHGDEILIGDTLITLEISSVAQRIVTTPQLPNQTAPTITRNGVSLWSPPVIAAISAFIIIFAALLGLLFTRGTADSDAGRKANARLRVARVIDTDLTSKVPLIDPSDISEPPTTEATATSADENFRQALLQVTADRGEPMGIEANVEVPIELKQYSEPKRFLAIQTAKAIEQRLRIPHDFAELASMKRESQFVELQPSSDSYVLYAVGGGVSDEQLTHFDQETGQSFPLYATEAELQKGLEGMAKTDERRALIVSFYQTRQARQLMSSEYNVLAQLARDFDGRSYDLNDPAARKQFKRRLLSLIRPAARGILEELALTYKNKFNRPLPLASLVRTEQYQHELSERNVNAARNSLPPHTTGLAFDISYRYMTAAEQNFLMSEIAHLEKAGRVEALRENNNSFHIFVFPDGHPPAESLIRRVMNEQ